MTAGELLKSASSRLASAGIGSARLDALVLLEDTLHRDRAWILAHPEARIPETEVKKLERKLARRARQVPLAYVRGHTEFYGRRFKINRRVLEPRPESEAMIELLKKLKLPREAKITDVGTGSGALGITAKLELPHAHVDLFDIDAGALAVAKHNAVMHELHLKVEKRDLLKGSHTAYDAILANLPYIPNTWKLHPSVLNEPKIALLGGKDGLDIYRRLFEQISGFKYPPRYVLTESMPPQHEKLAGVAKSHGYKPLNSQDFIQVFKNT